MVLVKWDTCDSVIPLDHFDRLIRQRGCTKLSDARINEH